MKKFLVVFSVVFVLALTVVSTKAEASTTWDVTGNYVWTVLGTYVHDISITSQLSDGTFSGVGGYPSGEFPYTSPGQTPEVITGLVTGNTISLTTTYAGPYNPGYSVTITGTIDSNGNISGSDPWSWTMTSGVAHQINNDIDGDGVVNSVDLCSGTIDDGAWSEALGPNRWEVDNGFWLQNKVVKGTPVRTASTKTLAYTYGCNGHQILDLLQDKLGDAMKGHRKFGLSTGLLEEFVADGADGVIDGMYLVETLTVNADDTDGVSSLNSLVSGQHYKLEASGIANAGDNIQFDADYSFRTPTSSTWTDSVSTYESYGDTLLDLMVNGGFVNWDNDAIYNSNHVYNYEMSGNGSPVTLRIYDVFYPGNTGNLTVKIYADL